jgi:hypothetical protein
MIGGWRKLKAVSSCKNEINKFLSSKVQLFQPWARLERRRRKEQTLLYILEVNECELIG